MLKSLSLVVWSEVYDVGGWWYFGGLVGWSWAGGGLVGAKNGHGRPDMLLLKLSDDFQGGIQRKRNQFSIRDLSQKGALKVKSHHKTIEMCILPSDQNFELILLM